MKQTFVVTIDPMKVMCLTCKKKLEGQHGTHAHGVDEGSR